MTLYHRSSTYKHTYDNVVGKSIGVVFINTCATKDLPYSKEKLMERRNNAVTRMTNIWKVDALKIYEDMTKEKVIQKFEWLIKQAE